MRGMMRLAMMGVPGAGGQSDTAAPTVEITSAAAATVYAAFSATITFSEPVVGFLVGDITAGNAALSEFAGSGAVYTVTVTPTAAGTVTLDIAAGVCTDAAGNDNEAATQFSRDYRVVLLHDTFTDEDSTALPSHAPDVNPSSASWVNVLGTFSVVGNSARATVLNGDGNAFARIDTGVVINVLAYRMLPGGTADVIRTCFFRGSGYSYIAVDVRPTKVLLRRAFSGSLSTLASASISLDPEAYHDFAVYDDGETITVVVNNDELLSYDTTEFNTQTQVGLYFQDQLTQVDWIKAENGPF